MNSVLCWKTINGTVSNFVAFSKGADGNQLYNQDESLNNEYSDCKSAIYFELERSDSSTIRRSSTNSSSSNSSHEDEEDLTEEPKMKRISTLIKAKVDVFSRAEIFAGKKKTGNVLFLLKLSNALQFSLC